VGNPPAVPPEGPGWAPPVMGLMQKCREMVVMAYSTGCCCLFFCTARDTLAMASWSVTSSAKKPCWSSRSVCANGLCPPLGPSLAVVVREHEKYNVYLNGAEAGSGSNAIAL
jgi:hypothetical protein